MVLIISFRLSSTSYIDRTNTHIQQATNNNYRHRWRTKTSNVIAIEMVYVVLTEIVGNAFDLHAANMNPLPRANGYSAISDLLWLGVGFISTILLAVSS